MTENVTFTATAAEPRTHSPRRSTSSRRPAAWSAMLKGKPLLIKPWTVGLARGVEGLLPTRTWDFMAEKVFRNYRSMDECTGR